VNLCTASITISIVPDDYDTPAPSACTNVLAHYEYDPFGTVITNWGTESTNNHFRFSTKYFDEEMGLYWYGYRYYSPALGRWISRDPLGDEAFFESFAGDKPRHVTARLRAESMGPSYLFTRNSPVYLWDSLGLAVSGTECCTEAVRQEGKEQLKRLYREKESTMTQPRRVRRNADLSCITLNAIIMDHFDQEEVPRCWGCRMERRINYYPLTFHLLYWDHWVVMCTSFGESGEVAERIIFDYWRDREPGEDPSDWFYNAYETTHPDSPPRDPEPTRCCQRSTR